MKPTLSLLAAAFCLGLTALPAGAQMQTAQVQIGVCGVPPLPPCERPGDRYDRRDERRDDRRDERRDDRRGSGPYVGRPAPDLDDDFGTVCRTRTLRCRTERPRPIGGRCTCEDDEGESVIGRVVR